MATSIPTLIKHNAFYIHHYFLPRQLLNACLSHLYHLEVVNDLLADRIYTSCNMPQCFMLLITIITASSFYMYIFIFKNMERCNTILLMIRQVMLTVAPLVILS